MDIFSEVYAELNSAQRQAVDTIDGPVLVVAGPGTGKTQLLSARVAHILRQTDALPQNILCLTFTESGALNMRERLNRFIGSDAYDVSIGTYHAFGSDIIRRYPEYFTETRLERPIDELGKRQIIMELVDHLAYSDPLKQTRHHIGDLISTISEVKRGLLTPDDLRNIAQANLKSIATCGPIISESLVTFAKRMPSKLTTVESAFEVILNALEADPTSAIKPPFQPLAKLAASELQQALANARLLNKTKPLTAWKNTWLAKDESANYVLAGRLEAERLFSLAQILEDYSSRLAKAGLYDFDDMILRTIETLKSKPDLRFSLQEQYQYILLDEFQDTNAAQLQLVELLTDNPVNEGRPNILAVGDDDQAIYAFQGAQYSNMLDFFNMYRGVKVINLSENYRSSAPLLEVTQGIAYQIKDSLRNALPQLTKQLIPAKNISLPETFLEHREYTSDVAERAGVAATIAELVKQGVSPREIAVLAPKHRYLEPLVPYLQDHSLAVSYDHRENILQAPAIRQLLTMSRLTVALHDRNHALADSLWPEVLSYEFWGHRVIDIWQLAWQANDEHEPWTKLLLSDSTFRSCGVLFAALAAQVAVEPLEIMLDRLIGTEAVLTGDKQAPSVRSPYRDFYAGESTTADRLYQVVTELSVLRARLREHQEQTGDQLTLVDLLDFVAQYEAANQQLLNTSPYHQADDAVQLMTVYKAKGLEFAHVIVLHAQDNVWGSTTSDSSNRLTLPINLSPIRHAGTSEDERLRALFVACSRARYGLHFTSHRATYAGKQVIRLKYLQEAELEPQVITSQILPKGYERVTSDNKQAPALAAIEHDWRTRHLQPDSDLKTLLHDRLQHFRLSPTHLTQFLDLEHAGPHAFLLSTLLRFSSAPSVDVAYGNAMHATLEWLQQQLNLTKVYPSRKLAFTRFSEFLARQQIFGEQYALQEARGHQALTAFLAAKPLAVGNKPEYSFRQEGVVVEGVHMNGKIDLLEIDNAAKTITVVDYKTGSLGSDAAKLHRYELQLYCYKILLNGSHSFANYTVEQGKLVFVEPDMNGGKILTKLITYDEAELARVRQLLSVVWQRIESLDLPDISHYGSSLTAIRQFEQDLLEGTI